MKGIFISKNIQIFAHWPSNLFDQRAIVTPGLLLYSNWFKFWNIYRGPLPYLIMSSFDTALQDFVGDTPVNVNYYTFIWSAAV